MLEKNVKKNDKIEQIMSLFRGMVAMITTVRPVTLISLCLFPDL